MATTPGQGDPETFEPNSVAPSATTTVPVGYSRNVSRTPVITRLGFERYRFTSRSGIGSRRIPFAHSPGLEVKPERGRGSYGPCPARASSTRAFRLTCPYKRCFDLKFIRERGSLEALLSVISYYRTDRDDHKISSLEIRIFVTVRFGNVFSRGFRRRPCVGREREFSHACKGRMRDGGRYVLSSIAHSKACTVTGHY